MKRFLIPAAVAVTAAAAPAVSSAATVATDLPCYLPGQTVTFGGAQFVPGAPFSVSGTGVFGSGTVDAAGNATATTSAPTLALKRRSAKTVAFQATDGTNTIPGAFKVVNGGAQWDGSGNPRGTVKWAFGGLTPGQPIYVHVRRGSKTIKTTRAGKAGGVCGTATKRLKRLPVASSQVRNGSYKVFVDSRKKFSRGGLQYGYSYRVFTTYRPG